MGHPHANYGPFTRDMLSPAGQADWDKMHGVAPQPTASDQMSSGDDAGDGADLIQDAPFQSLYAGLRQQMANPWNPNPEHAPNRMYSGQQFTGFARPSTGAAPTWPSFLAPRKIP